MVKVAPKLPSPTLAWKMALFKKGPYQETKGFELGQGPKLPWPTLPWKWIFKVGVMETKGFELGQGRGLLKGFLRASPEVFLRGS